MSNAENITNEFTVLKIRFNNVQADLDKKIYEIDCDNSMKDMVRKFDDKLRDLVD